MWQMMEEIVWISVLQSEYYHYPIRTAKETSKTLKVLNNYFECKMSIWEASCKDVYNLPHYACKN